MPIQRRLFILLVCVAVAGLLSACSGVEQKRRGYLHSESIAPLKLPEGLTSPQSKEALPLPQVDPLAEPVDVNPPVNLPDELPAEPSVTSQESAPANDE